jgi:hypothetical protein
VATYSTGITATWGTVAFSEVTDLSWSYGGAPAKDRLTESSVRWTDDVGSVLIVCLGTANVSTAEYGKRKQLVLGGGGANLTINAIYESLSVAPELNGVTRYTVTFKLLDG